MKSLLVLLLGFALAVKASSVELSFPSNFKSQTIASPAGADIFVRSGGSGPAVVLIHGFGDTGDMWVPLAVELAKTHTVIVPDLRGMGKSSHPAGGYDKKTQADDIRAVVTALGFDQSAVVGHDIGNMVAFAYAVRYADKVERIAFMDAPIPGIGPWDEVLKSPLLWHFNFGGPDAERLVQGRERIYLDRFWNEFAADRTKIDEPTRAHYATLYAQPGAMHSAFEQFRAFTQDADDNRKLAPKLTMPVLAAGGAKSFGSMMAAVMRAAATNVREAVVPDAGHWVMEENPAYVIAMLSDFLGEKERAVADARVTPAEFQFPGGPGTGSSAVTGIQTLVLKGDPDQAGPYTILLRVPAHTKIAAHNHPDDRVSTVVSGTWYFGYGEIFDQNALKPLPVGSFYTEPPRRMHFAETRDDAVTLQITGFGPSGTLYSDPAADPRKAAH